MNELNNKAKDPIEEVKQKVQETKTIYLGKFKPQKNHTLFEVNMDLKTIEKAIFDEVPAIKFEDAVKGLKSASKKITKKANCIYVSALNKKNAIKILKRNHNIEFV